MTYEKPKNVSDVFAAWAAGFFDGEGCVGIDHARGYLISRVSIVQADQQVLEDIKAVFGGSVWRKNQGKLTKRILWVWGARGRVAGDFAAAVLPYLRVKRKQAEVLLKFVATLDYRVGQRRLSEEILNRRRAMRTELAALIKGRPEDYVDGGKTWRHV